MSRQLRPSSVWDLPDSIKWSQFHQIRSAYMRSWLEGSSLQKRLGWTDREFDDHVDIWHERMAKTQ